MTKIIVFDVPQIVKVRVYDVDIEGLKRVLRDSKRESKLTNKDLANELNVPITKVEHWFRNDKCFSIPDAEIWLSLKTLLNISTNEFDESILTFEERDGVYEKSNRVYGVNGLAPTITSSDSAIKIITL